jgi:putative acetyltransferase
MIIRPEAPEDAGPVRLLNERAFEQPLEANLIAKVRHACPDALSLVAEDDGAIAGHILFTPLVVQDTGAAGMGLGPMAVLPERQRQGIGSALVNRGLEMLRGRGCPFVVVVGHPEYYPRFGFERASKYGLRCQWDGVPDAAFMALVIDPGIVPRLAGLAEYRPEFSESS